MWVLFLEAFGAMALLVLIVWWTMFHGRNKGERARGKDGDT
jgi:cbb3-type cytochrome oxidase subunit 3